MASARRTQLGALGALSSGHTTLSSSVIYCVGSDVSFKACPATHIQRACSIVSGYTVTTCEQEGEKKISLTAEEEADVAESWSSALIACKMKGPVLSEDAEKCCAVPSSGKNIGSKCCGALLVLRQGNGRAHTVFCKGGKGGAKEQEGQGESGASGQQDQQDQQQQQQQQDQGESGASGQQQQQDQDQGESGASGQQDQQDQSEEEEEVDKLTKLGEKVLLRRKAELVSELAKVNADIAKIDVETNEVRGASRGS